MHRCSRRCPALGWAVAAAAVVVAASGGQTSCADALVAGIAPDGERMSPAAVLAVCDRREQQASMFRATWQHERTYTKYWANCHVPSARDEYVTLWFGESELVLDGDRLRFDSGAVDSSGDVMEREGAPAVDQFGRGAHDDARRVFRDDRVRDKGAAWRTARTFHGVAAESLKSHIHCPGSGGWTSRPFVFQYARTASRSNTQPRWSALRMNPLASSSSVMRITSA